MSASQSVVMPKLGLTMTEGVLAEWKIAPGDAVKAGDVIFIVETDKISNEIEAGYDAIVEALHVAAGAVVPVGDPVATLRGECAVQHQPYDVDKPEPGGAAPRRVRATPLARRLAADTGLDIRRIEGSGPHGRIVADDVVAAAGDASIKPTAVAAAVELSAEPCILRPLAQYQKITARRLVEAKREIPHFYVIAEADISELLGLRMQLNADPNQSRLTVNHFIITAVARALAAMPNLNVVWTDEGVKELGRVDIGIAIDSPRGLIAPVLPDLGAADVDQVASAASALVERARAGRLSLAELNGGAISVSNVGMFGATGLIPIINPGQSAILGVGRNVAQFRPDEAGQPILRQILGLTLSCDHRVIDGALAARFLRQVQHGLEAPLFLLRRPAEGRSA